MAHLVDHNLRERVRAGGLHCPAPDAAATGRDAARGLLAEALVDSDPDALFVVTEAGRVCFANTAARSTSTAALRIVADRLSACGPRDEPALARAIAAACAGSASALVLQVGDGEIRVDVGPLPSTTLASVRVIDPAARLERALSAFTGRFGLTRSEAALARALARGVLAPEHARRRGVAISTVRSQAQNLLRKTGATSQVEFLARLRAEAA